MNEAPVSQDANPKSEIRNPKWLEGAGLLLILLLAGFLRFYDLHELPPGLWFDEGLNGLNALHILHDDPARIYFDNREYFGGEIRNAQEPMFHYLLAVSIALLGPTALAIRIVSAVIGLLTVGVFYGMARAIWGRAAALLAAFLLAVFRWHFHFSRIGFRTILVPLFACLFFWVWWRGIERRSRAWLTVSGLCLGLGLYTYPAFQLIIPAWLCWWGLLYWRRKDQRLILLHGIFWPGLVGLLVVLPLLAYFASHPEVASGRVGSLSIFRQPDVSGWQLLLQNLWDNIRHFWWRGDHVAKHNVPLMAVFDPVTSIVFAIGVLATITGIRRDDRKALPLLWAGWISLASILSFGAPNLLRTLGMTPAIVLILANGYLAIAVFAGKRLSKAFAGVALALLLGWFAANETHRYFVVWRDEPKVFDEFNTIHRNMAEVAKRWDDAAIHIDADLYNHPTVRYLLYGRNTIAETKLPDSLLRQAGDQRDRILVYWPWTFQGSPNVDPVVQRYPNGWYVWRSRGNVLRAYRIPIDLLKPAVDESEAEGGQANE